MKVEHVAFNVRDPQAVAQWYVEHLGFTIKRSANVSPFAHFLADQSGSVMLEIYYNPSVPVPDYRGNNPLQLHLAFVSQDVAADRSRLLAAGATAVGAMDTPASGDELAMLRDPWGFPIQLVKRAAPMLD